MNEEITPEPDTMNVINEAPLEGLEERLQEFFTCYNEVNERKQNIIKYQTLMDQIKTSNRDNDRIPLEDAVNYYKHMVSKQCHEDAMAELNEEINSQFEDIVELVANLGKPFEYSIYNIDKNENNHLEIRLSSEGVAILERSSLQGE